MGKIKFNISEKGIIGITPVFVIPDVPSVARNLERPVGTREVPATSLLGTPVIDNLAFEGGSYIDSQGNILGYKGITLDAVLMTVTQSKNIVRTQVAGRSGSVKEYISSGDFEISIAGSLQEQDGKTYPELAVERLISICELPVQLSVISPFLQRFGIQELVINNYQFIQKPAYEGQQIFQLNAVSDSPIQLLLNNESA